MSMFKKEEPKQPAAVRQIEDHDTYRIIRLQGAVNAANAGEMDAFGGWMRANAGVTSKHLLVDMAGVTGGDTAGIAVLVRALADFRKGGHEVRLFNVGAEQRGVLEITKVDKLVRVFGSEEQAIAG